MMATLHGRCACTPPRKKHTTQSVAALITVAQYKPRSCPISYLGPSTQCTHPLPTPFQPSDIFWLGIAAAEMLAGKRLVSRNDARLHSSLESLMEWGAVDKSSDSGGPDCSNPGNDGGAVQQEAVRTCARHRSSAARLLEDDRKQAGMLRTRSAL